MSRSRMTEDLLRQFNVDGPKGNTRNYLDGWTRTFSKIRCKKCDIGVEKLEELTDGLCEECFRKPPF